MANVVKVVESDIDVMTKYKVVHGLIGTANQAFYPIRSGNATLLLLQWQNAASL